MTNKEKFLSLLRTVKRDGIENLISWLETTDFFEAPASTRFHESFEGGLLQHSLNVYYSLYRLNQDLDLNLNDESIIVSALLHDLCKADFYKATTRNVKVNGKWETAPYYTIDEKMNYGGHGSKSVFIVQSFIHLTYVEASAINCHMGVTNNDYSAFDCYRKNCLALFLHVADMMSTCDWYIERFNHQ